MSFLTVVLIWLWLREERREDRRRMAQRHEWRALRRRAYFINRSLRVSSNANAMSAWGDPTHTFFIARRSQERERDDIRPHLRAKRQMIDL